MCIGIPGQIVSIDEKQLHTAWVDVCGVKRQVNIALVNDREDSQSLVGEWVLVHVGFAMSILDEAEARDTLDALEAMAQVEEEVNSFMTQGSTPLNA
jgi:hydrogenase expression/formation protein HypC